MTSNLVLTLIGDDKPGLVEALAETIASHSGNWEESSMSQLAGKFAGILRVSVADSEVKGLIESLQALSGELKLVIERADAELPSSPPQPLKLGLVGNDRPGIVREISQALAGLGVNVEELHTECVPAPMSGDTLFKARAVLRVPAALGLETLQSELEGLADDLIVEIH